MPIGETLQTSTTGPDFAYLVVVLLGLVSAGLLGYIIGIQDQRKRGSRIVSLEEVFVSANYSIPFIAIKDVTVTLEKELNYGGQLESWLILTEGNTIELLESGDLKARDFVFNKKKMQKAHMKRLKNTRPGLPMQLTLVGHRIGPQEFEAEVICRPKLYFRMTQMMEYRWPQQQVEEAQHECTSFVRKVMVGVLGGKELRPPSVGTVSRDTEAVRRLRKRGMGEEIQLLNEARSKMVQGHPEDAVKDCRTILEHVIAKATDGAGGKTGSFENDLSRLESKGRVTRDTAEFLRKVYGYLSQDVHGGFKADKKEGDLSIQTVESTILYLFD
jgi:hypothetical protein